MARSLAEEGLDAEPEEIGEVSRRKKQGQGGEPVLCALCPATGFGRSAEQSFGSSLDVPLELQKPSVDFQSS